MIQMVHPPSQHPIRRVGQRSVTTANQPQMAGYAALARPARTCRMNHGVRTWREAIEMRLTGVRFTVRRMLVAVAIVAIMMGALRERQLRLKSIADHHFPQAGYHVLRGKIIGMYMGPMHAGWETDSDRKIFWHRYMYYKYMNASKRPWLPVLPDWPAP